MSYSDFRISEVYLMFLAYFQFPIPLLPRTLYLIHMRTARFLRSLLKIGQNSLPSLLHNLGWWRSEWIVVEG
jgi:hypothetical protein